MLKNKSTKKMSNRRKDKDPNMRVHFIRNSVDEGNKQSPVVSGDVSMIPSVANIRRQYEERVMLLADGLTRILRDLQNDKVILQMDKDITTSPHVKDRILEILGEALRSGM